MKKILMLTLMLTVAFALSAQNTVDNLVGKLLKAYPQTPSRETLDKDPETGKLLRHITQYSFRNVKQKKLEPLISALRSSGNGYYKQESKMGNDGYAYELRVADADPDYRTVYILQTTGSDAELHVLYGRIPLDEMTTNFTYSTGKYYTLSNKSTEARLGISFDYNCHASTFRETSPSGRGPNGMTITNNKVFRFRMIPAVVVDTRITDAVSEDCYIVSEDLFALEDGSESTEGQWLIFRYLEKGNPFQQWRLIETDGSVTIINKATGRCVDLAGGETKEGAAVFSYDINEDPKTNSNQKWVIEEARDE